MTTLHPERVNRGVDAFRLGVMFFRIQKFTRPDVPTALYKIP